MYDFTAALSAAQQGNGCVRIPAGEHYVKRGPILHPMRSVALIGEGEGVTRLVFENDAGLSFNFTQDGAQQPHGLTMEGLTLAARGACQTALGVSYGSPGSTNDHYRPSVRLRDVRIESGSNGSWANGIDLADAWNVTLDNVYVSGSSADGVWNNMRGAGIALHRMCVNAHLTNVRTNFWATGIQVHADKCNTEGLFFSNCSMVAVKRGLWVKGNPSVSPGRISTVNWTGGMIEARVGGVKGGSAGVHLEHVHTALITGCQFITETISANVENTYAAILQNCRGVVIAGCDMNAWTHGVMTTGDCKAIVSSANTFTNCDAQLVFSPGTCDSRSGGHVRVNNELNEQDYGDNNELSP